MSQPKITRKKENMEQEKPQLTTEQLNLAMENYHKQKAIEQQQQAESEFKVWQLNIFKERSGFWQKIYQRELTTVEDDPNGGPSIKIGVEDSAKVAALYADAALEQWDDRFMPKPPAQETQPEGESTTNAPVQ